MIPSQKQCTFHGKKFARHALKAKKNYFAVKWIQTATKMKLWEPSSGFLKLFLETK